MTTQEDRINNNKDTKSLIEELSDDILAVCVGGTGFSTPSGTKIYGQKANGSAIQNDPNGSTRTVSDRNIKENCSPVDMQQILAQVAKLPIQTWNYKQQNPEVRHIGPMAQDFAAAFSVGESDRYIELVDANGVALAAIQALYQMLQDKDAQIDELRSNLNLLQQQVNLLEN